ncbi:MAG: T9SS type A sorting domain-containing protein [Bacteroidota bacterium]
MKTNQLKWFLFGLFFVLTARTVQSQILISGVNFNPSGTDSIYEYVQLIATETIDFSVDSFSVVVANNGTVGANGWAQGGSTSYKFDLTSGVVHTGDVFYVGGDGMLIDGLGSADLSSELWVRTINVTTTNGDGFGTKSSSGVFGNAGNNADGIAVFQGTVLTAASVPVDAIFYGKGIGTAYAPPNGYTVPTGDFYDNTQGMFGAGTNTYFVPFNNNGRDTLLRFTGVYNTITNTWANHRVPTYTSLTPATTIPDIATQIVLVDNSFGIAENKEMKTGISPNPSDGVFYVSNPNTALMNIAVYDITGKEVIKLSSADKKILLQMTGMVNGVYFVKITDSKNGTQKTLKAVLR